MKTLRLLVVGVVHFILATHGQKEENFEARIARLEALSMATNPIIVEDYVEILHGDFSILNAVSRHFVRSLQSFSLLPRTDKECSWSYRQERCEPRCLCSFQPRLGDLHPGRACRLIQPHQQHQQQQQQQLVLDVHVPPVPCDDADLPSSPPGPIRRSLDWVARIISSLVSVRFPDPASVPALPTNDASE